MRGQGLRAVAAPSRINSAAAAAAAPVKLPSGVIAVRDLPNVLARIALGLVDRFNNYPEVAIGGFQYRIFLFEDLFEEAIDNAFGQGFLALLRGSFLGAFVQLLLEAELTPDRIVNFLYSWLKPPLGTTALAVGTKAKIRDSILAIGTPIIAACASLQLPQSAGPRRHRTTYSRPKRP